MQAKEKPAGNTIAIVGAGIVGVATAIWLQRAGCSVILLDRKDPGEGASHGNGGVLASCSIVPVTTPGMLAKAPRMVFDRNQPLFLKWTYFPKLLPWLVRYLGHANAGDVKRIADALYPIVGNSLADHQALAAGTGAEKWIVPGDYLFGYRDRRHFEADGFGWSIRRDHGFKWDELEGNAVSEYDPVLTPDLGFAVRLPNHGRITDPGLYVKDLANYFQRNGGQVLKADVEHFIEDSGAIAGVRAGGQTIACDGAVLAAGAWSKSLARKLRMNIPLESERGYHLELLEPSMMPRSPIMIVSGRFVATPMDGRLRLAGILEFGGLAAPVSRAPMALLQKNIEWAIPGIRWKETRQWMGHRPAPADSIPLIGEVPGTRNAYLAFGHHHVGLTGGAKTGKLLSQLIMGQKLDTDLAPYSPSRFQ